MNATPHEIEDLAASSEQREVYRPLPGQPEQQRACGVRESREILLVQQVLVRMSTGSVEPALTKHPCWRGGNPDHKSALCAWPAISVSGEWSGLAANL